MSVVHVYMKLHYFYTCSKLDTDFFKNLSTDEVSFPQELVSHGLCEELLHITLRQVCNGDPLSWRLTSVPTVGFYQALHSFLKRSPLTSKLSKREIAEFYMAIDPKLKAKGSRPDNVYRFIENLSKIPPDETLYYGTQERVIKQLQTDIGHCNEQVKEMTLACMEMREKLLESKCKLETTEKSLRDITNQRDAVKRSRDFTKSKLFKSERKLELLQEDYAQVLIEKLDLTDTPPESALTSICSKGGRTYPPAIRKLYYSLLSKQIPASQVADIIKTVLKTFNPSEDVENLPLPQKSCAGYMRKEELTVSNAHKATVLCEAAEKSMGFHLNTDGTTKNKKKNWEGSL